MPIVEDWTEEPTRPGVKPPEEASADALATLGSTWFVSIQAVAALIEQRAKDAMGTGHQVDVFGAAHLLDLADDLRSGRPIDKVRR